MNDITWNYEKFLNDIKKICEWINKQRIELYIKIKTNDKKDIDNESYVGKQRNWRMNKWIKCKSYRWW